MMKKLVISALAAMTLISATALAAETYSFENGTDGLEAVTNTLESGAEAAFTDGFVGRGLSLDGSYGLKIGSTDGDFTAAAMVRYTTSGDNKNIFFKNMGSASDENWTGLVQAGGKLKLWARGGDFFWTPIITGDESFLNRWVYVTYTESNGIGSLYANGVLIGSEEVLPGGGDIYAGATFWTADAAAGVMDELFFDGERAISADEAKEMFTALALKNPEMILERISVPEWTMTDLSLPTSFGALELSWASSDEGVIAPDGKVTRGTEDKTVILTVSAGGKALKEYPVLVYALPPAAKQVGDVVLSYIFDDNDGIVIDRSGNGNDGILYGGMTGSYFDGKDDFVEMPTGLLNGLDEFTIVMRLRPELVQTHQFTFCFGNSTSEYFFLNTSVPGSNTIRAAITNTGSGGEADLRSVPGLRYGEEAAIAITVKGSYGEMYVNGIPVAAKDLGLSPSALGKTTQNWLAKSPYGDRLYTGDIYEFSIYSYAMSPAVISAAHFVSDADAGYIEDMRMSDGTLTVTLTRDCMISARFLGADGSELFSTTRKVSADDLSAVLSYQGAANIEIAAFDAATGIIKDSAVVSSCEGLAAYTFFGRGSTRIVNTSERPASAIVAGFSRDGSGHVTGISACTAYVGPGAEVTVKSPDCEPLGSYVTVGGSSNKHNAFNYNNNIWRLLT